MNLRGVERPGRGWEPLSGRTFRQEMFSCPGGRQGWGQAPTALCLVELGAGGCRPKDGGSESTLLPYKSLR